MAKISGTSSWRAFTLPFDRTGTTHAPTRLDLNIFLPGRGIVLLGPMRLMQRSEPVNPSFGPVIERVLTVNDKGYSDTLDLDSE